MYREILMKANITSALEQAWVKKTSYCPDEWTTDNPARGQCVVSSLVIQNYFGGDIGRVEATFMDGRTEKHFFNILPNGEVLDTTKSQYGNKVIFKESIVSLDSYVSVREKLLADSNTKERYLLLLKRVEKAIS